MEQGWGRGREQNSPVQWKEHYLQRSLCQKGDATCKQLENKVRGRVGQNEEGKIDDGQIRRRELRVFTFTLRAAGFYSYSRQARASFKHTLVDFPGGPMVENPPINAGDTGSIAALGRFHMLWGNQACALQLLKPLHPRACVPQLLSPCAAVTEAPTA